jgi:hypothetical protein
MKNHISIVGTMIVLQAARCAAEPLAPANDPSQTLTITRVVPGVRVALRLETQAFDRDAHHIEQRDGRTLIDGLRPIGTDGGARPYLEFKKFELRWNGRLVPLKPEIFQCIYNVSLEQTASLYGDGHTVLFVLSDTGKSVLLFLPCGDAVKDGVWLSIDEHGDWRRYVASAGTEISR